MTSKLSSVKIYITTEDKNMKSNNQRLNLVNNINSIALVETSRIKLLNEGEYEPITIENLPLIPIYVCPIVCENTYELYYKLLIPSIKIASTYIETYTKESEITFKSIPSLEYTDKPVIYDNENIHTLSKIKSEQTTMSYIANHKRRIYEFAEIISKHINEEVSKQLKKVPK